MIPTLAGIIPTPQEDILQTHFAHCVGILFTNSESIEWEYFLQNSAKILNKALQMYIGSMLTCSYTSVKFLPVLHSKIMISYLIWKYYVRSNS